jgi:hypothetical protein
LSSHDIPDFPAFDMLVGKATAAPYRGFGDVIPDPREIERELHIETDEVLRDVRESFGARLSCSSTTPHELDRIVERMWQTGWDPHVGNLNLFTRSFGLLLIKATLDLLGGTLVFREPGKDNVYVHTSICWPGVEAFPFHKAIKCLTEIDGESMSYFVRGVGHELESRGLLTPEMKERLPRPNYLSNGE